MSQNFFKFLKLLRKVGFRKQKMRFLQNSLRVYFFPAIMSMERFEVMDHVRLALIFSLVTRACHLASSQIDIS